MKNIVQKQISHYQQRLCAHICWISTFAWGAVDAQELAVPPVRQLVDANGVDLMSGQLTARQHDVDIGPPESALTYGRNSPGATTSTDIFLSFVDSSYVAASIGGSAENFTWAGSTFTAQSGMGSTLVFDSASQNYIYTLRDGTEIRFPSRVSSNHFVVRAISVRKPDGLLTEYFLKDVTTSPSVIPTFRVQSVRNNAGYQLKLEYGTVQLPFGTTTMVTKAAALNRTQSYCDPNADTCAATANAPAVTFERSEVPITPPYSIPRITATDALGRQTAWTVLAQTTSGETVNGLSAIKSRAATSDDTTATYEMFQGSPSGESPAVTSVTRRGSTWDYEILNNNYMVSWTMRVTDPLGHAREVNTDLIRTLVTSDKDELGRITSYQYDSYGRRTRVTYPEGNYVQLTYDGRGNVTETRRVAKPGASVPDIVESAVYPSTCANPKTCNKPTSTTDARGFTTDYTYDPVHGGVLTVTEPAPSSGAVRPQTRYTYTPLYAWYLNSAGTLVQASTPIYKLTTISSCRTTDSCAGTADEAKTTFTYESGSSSVPSNLLLTSVTRSSGDGTISATTSFAYDHRGNRVSVDGPLAGAADTTTTRYDVLRRVVGVVGPDPDGAGPLKRRALRYSYNADDEPITIDRGTVEGLTDAQWLAFSLLERVSFGYDTAGRRSSASMIGGGSTLAVSQFSYDAAGQLECSAVRMNAATFSALPTSACSHAASGSDGPDRITRTSYDAKGRAIKVQTGYGTVSQRDESSITYTINGNVYTVSDARNNLTTNEYDGFDRLIKTRFPSSSGVSSTSDFEQLSYDDAGNVLQRRLRDGQSINFVYDRLGRLQTRNLPGSEPDIQYGYDNLGHITSMMHSGQTLTFSYDSLGLLRTETGPHGTLTSDYDAAGRRKRLTWPDSYFAEYEYLVTGEMTRVRENGAVSGVGLLATYGYDDLGRRTSLLRGNGTGTAYAYDNASRLDQFTQDLASSSADQTVDFGYNPASQITTRTSDNDTFTWTQNQLASTSYSANALNQYTAVGAAVPTYDARGNLTNFGSGTYSYSAENRLTTAPGSTSLSYDPAGRLYQTSSASATVRFAYDGTQLVAEYNASNQLLRRYVHGASTDEPLVWYEGIGTTIRRWLHADERGSIVAISATDGAPFAINRFDEHGTPAATNVGRFQFTGQAWIDEVKLYYFKARFYSPSLGRFMQTDPIGFAGGLNLYAYVGGDPINAVDPFGLTEEVVVHGTRLYDPWQAFDWDFSWLEWMVGINDADSGAHEQKPHRYEIKTFTLCSADDALSALKDEGVSAPGAPAITFEGVGPRIELWSIFSPNPIYQIVDTPNRTITNIALPGHAFLGQVTTKVEPAAQGTSVIHVVGTGVDGESKSRGLLNNVAGYLLFGIRNAAIKGGCDAMNGYPSGETGGGM